MSYLMQGLHLGSSAVCISVSIRFYRVKKEGWWLMVAAVFALPLVVGPILGLYHGIPPAPFALQTVEQLPSESSGNRFGTAHGAVVTRVAGVTNKSTSGLNSITILMAVSLTWAYVTDKKKRAQSPGS